MLRLLNLLRNLILAHAPLSNALRGHLGRHAHSCVAVQTSHFLGQEDEIDVFEAEIGGFRVEEVYDGDEEGLWFCVVLLAVWEYLQVGWGRFGSGAGLQGGP